MSRRVTTHGGIQLVSAPRDQIVSPISRSGVYQPLGLLSIASCLLERNACTEIEILDGEFLPVSEIASRLSAGIVGISCTTPSYRNALCLARAAKERGATVVLGGSHATALGSDILANRPEVDFVVRSDGEDAFTRLVLGDPPSGIPNLVHRNLGRVVANPVADVSLPALPPMRRDLLPLEPYVARYAAQPGAYPHRRPAAVYSHKGCMWRHKSGGCLFCGRQDGGWRGRPETDVWREVTDLSNALGVNFIWDVSDSFLSCRDWVLDFASSRPRSIDIEFFVYARPSELDEQVVTALADIGCKEVFVGMESGNNGLLAAANKGTTTADNLRAARLLASRGMKMFPCFVLGLPGETDESLEETVKHAAALTHLCECSTVSASVFVPLPGSPAYASLKGHDRIAADMLAGDIVDVESLARLWVSTFCFASWQAIHRAVYRILDLCPNKSSFFNFEDLRSGTR